MAVDVIDELDTDDYAAFSRSRDAAAPSEETEDEEAPAAGEEEEPQSEPADKAGQIAEDSGTEDEEQQEEEAPGKDDKKPKDNGLARRMRELTGKIKTLESQLAKRETPADVAEEAQEEVVSSPESEADKAEKPVRPRLADFEDTDEESAWDQYEKATQEFNRLETAAAIAAALAEQEQKLELKHATATANAAWSKAASRFPDYDEVVSDKVQISQAMESVMRMDPDSGTALAYWLGKNPAESLRIAKVTLANTEAEWVEARVRASFELGQIRAQLTEPGKDVKPAPKSPTAASPPTTKKITSANKPPTVIRGGTAPPQTDVLNEDDAEDYTKWNRAREAQLKRK